jgi:hypothetical protein
MEQSMRKRTVLFAILAMALLTGFALAADVSGKWVAQMPGRDGGTREVPMTFKADGAKLTGTVAGMGGETEITDGKVDGDKISFTVKREFNGNSFVMTYKGVVAGDEIKFSVLREGGDQPAREFSAKRAK